MASMGKAAPTTHIAKNGFVALGGVTDTITASTTSTIAGGTALKKGINNITVSANDTDAVTLPNAEAGLIVIVSNMDAAQDIAIFPSNSSPTINDESAGGKVTMGQQTVTICIGLSRTKWIAMNGAAIDA
jgi:hypothetical protein